jgi:hypothetical protein
MLPPAGLSAGGELLAIAGAVGRRVELLISEVKKKQPGRVPWPPSTVG